MSSTMLCVHAPISAGGIGVTTPNSQQKQQRQHSPAVLVPLRSAQTSRGGDRIAVLRGRQGSARWVGRRRSSNLVTASAADPPPSAPDFAPSPIPVAPAFIEAENSNEAAAAEVLSNEGPTPLEAPKSFWQSWRAKSAEMRDKLSKWGLAAVLAYGLFDGITYTTFFVLAFLSYEKSTGQNPAANLKSLLGIVVLMWGGNNVTRPFRVAGAAALAPFIDTGLKKLQKALRLPNQLFAFMLCVGVFACLCFGVIGVLILSRYVAIV